MIERFAISTDGSAIDCVRFNSSTGGTTRRSIVSFERGVISAHDAWVVARHTGRWWMGSARTLNRAIPIRYFDGLGLPRLAT